MSLIRTILIVSLVIFFINTTHADTLRFISGEIYAAEVSTNKLLIGDADQPGNLNELNPIYKQFNYAKKLTEMDEDSKCYLVLFVKLDPKRKLSIYDYTVVINGDKYNCVSITKGDKIFQPFDPTDKSDDSWEVTGSNSIYKMLFVIEYSDIDNKGSKMNFKLVYNLSTPRITKKIKATVLGDDPFSTVGSLKGGKFKSAVKKQKPAQQTAKPTRQTAKPENTTKE